jgi:hypothetical protein
VLLGGGKTCWAAFVDEFYRALPVATEMRVLSTLIARNL